MLEALAIEGKAEESVSNTSIALRGIEGNICGASGLRGLWWVCRWIIFDFSLVYSGAVCVRALWGRGAWSWGQRRGITTWLLVSGVFLSILCVYVLAGTYTEHVPTSST